MILTQPLSLEFSVIERSHQLFARLLLSSHVLLLKLGDWNVAQGDSRGFLLLLDRLLSLSCVCSKWLKELQLG